MRLVELTVSQFRSWAYKTLEIHPSLQYLKGPNGSGKTSLLEAIYFLSQGRSPLTHRDRECIQHGRDSFSIRGEFEEADVETISMQYSKGGSDSGKIVKVDGDPIGTLSELRQYISTVYFSSEDLLTLKKGPSRRRHLLNDVLSRLKPDYMEHLRQYQNALDQRNSLMKKPSPDEVLLESIEETMADNGRRVMEDRQSFIPELEADFVGEHDTLTDSSAQLSLEYKPNVDNPDHFLDDLEEERSRAQQRGYTTIGPQRDDWEILRDGRNVGKFASQGELRTLVFALKFAVAGCILSRTSQQPILLFDDMFSDLDDDRTERCLNEVQSRSFQLIFTGTRSLVDASLIGGSSQVDLRVG